MQSAPSSTGRRATKEQSRAAFDRLQSERVAIEAEFDDTWARINAGDPCQRWNYPSIAAVPSGQVTRQGWRQPAMRRATLA